MGETVAVIAPIRAGSRIRQAVPWLAGLGAVAATLAAGYLEYQSRALGALVILLTTGLFLGTGLLLIAQHRRGDGALALLAGLLLVPQGLTLPVIAGVTPISGHPISLALPDTGWTRPLDLAFVVPVVALVLRVPHGRLGIVGRGLVGVLAAALVATPVIEVAVGSSAPTPGDGAVTVLALTSAAGVVAGALLRGGRVARQARIPLLVVTVGMLLAAALQVYGDTLSVDPTPPPWATVLGLEGPRDVRDFCAAMVPVALVADAIRRAEARADIGRRVVAGARVGGVDGIRDALRSGLLEPEIDLLPPVAIDHNVAAVAGRSDRGRIPLSSHDGSPLAIVELPQGKVDPLVVDAALAAARVGLEHADAVERLRMRIDELEASRSEFLTTVERERRRLKIQLSSGLREPLVGLAALLAEASAELAHGDEGAARRLLMAARARLTVAHADLRLLARGVYPAVLSQSGLAVALRALAEEAEGRLRVVVSPSVEARRRSGVVEAAAYFIVATLPVMLAAGQRVVRVPTRLMADARRAGRDRGKSDPIDAEAVAWAALRHPDLPVASLDGASREVKLLSDFRRDLVRQRTQVCNKIRWYLHELDPSLHIPSRGLRRRCVADQIARELDRFDGVVARLARELVGRCADLNRQITGLERELQTLVRQLAPSLLAVRGCGVLSAAVLVDETAGVERFRSKDHFARFTGTAPIPVWSGASEGKVRLNRGGNRLTNTALHMIAVTQSRTEGAGRAYLEKAQARGKTRTEAIRLLRRRISDAVFAALRADAELIKLTVPSTPHHTMPAAA